MQIARRALVQNQRPAGLDFGHRQHLTPREVPAECVGERGAEIRQR
jgi:hypothetical protein